MGWPVEAQERALEEAGVLDRDSLYVDTLKPDQAKAPGRVRCEWLTQRVDLLRPTSRRGETIAVATLLVLGLSERDLMLRLAEADSNRGAIVLAVDSGLAIEPGGGMAAANAALADWQRAKIQARTKTRTIAGNVAAAEAKRRVTAAKLKAADAAVLWGLPTDEISTTEIARRSGVSVKTLYAELGQRSIAQQKQQRRIRRMRR